MDHLLAPLRPPTPSPDRLARNRLGDEIAELSAHLDAASARLLDLIGEFDTRGGWNNGFPSCAAWLTWRIGLAPGAAREHVRVARARFFPQLNLSAGVGLEAFNTKYLFMTPESLIYNAAGDLVGPLLNKAAIKADYLTANAAQLEAIAPLIQKAFFSGGKL